MKKNNAQILIALALGAGMPLTAYAMGMPGNHQRNAVLRARNGIPIIEQLDPTDTITAANGSVYMAGPPYSPKQTCGTCHDYNAVTRAFHFREGTGRKGDGISDHWSDEQKDGTLYKYLSNAYAHLLSPGESGAW